MYGLFLRALQVYLVATFGPDPWARILQRAGLPAEGFEPLLRYDSARFRTAVSAAAVVLGRAEDAVLEDLGTFIVTDPDNPVPRRLLRFCGASFAELLMALEELPDRARIALTDVEVPPLRLQERGPGAYGLWWDTEIPELLHVLVGMLRAMADDYGALVFIEIETAPQGEMGLSIRLAAAQFAEGRRFDLAAAV